MKTTLVAVLLVILGCSGAMTPDEEAELPAAADATKHAPDPAPAPSGEPSYTDDQVGYAASASKLLPPALLTMEVTQIQNHMTRDVRSPGR